MKAEYCPQCKIIGYSSATCRKNLNQPQDPPSGADGDGLSKRQTVKNVAVYREKQSAKGKDKVTSASVGSVLTVLREWALSIFAQRMGTSSAGASLILGGPFSLGQTQVINQGVRDKITSAANRYMTEVRRLPLPQSQTETVYRAFRELEEPPSDPFLLSRMHMCATIYCIGGLRASSFLMSYLGWGGELYGATLPA